MSDSKSTKQGFLNAFGLASREERAFGWGLVLPLAVLVVGLKAWRVVERGELATWWAAPDLIRSEVLALGAFATLGWACLRAMATRRSRLVVLGAAQVVAAIWAALDVIANHFFLVTGSTFDLHLLLFSLGRVGETWDVVASEVPVGAWIFLGAVVVAMLALPWVVHRWSRPPDRPPLATPKVLAATMALGVGCMVFAVVPAAGEDYRAFGRANVINLAMSLHEGGLAAGEMVMVDRRPLDGLELVEGEGTGQGPTNVAIIILESTRAQSMTVYNPEMETTPFLAELAERSTVADRAYAVVPHTSKALVATLCGLEPRLHMPITEALSDGLPARCLAALLGDKGYRSLFMQSATERFEQRPDLVDNMGYDDFIPLELMDRRGFEDANYFGLEDAVMLPPNRQWLEEHVDKPFLATYLTLTPHHDYLAPTRYGRLDFHDDDELNRYKNTLYYVDQFTKELFEQYRELGIYEDTLFVIVGDHGEGFREHGRSQHDNVIWEPGIHVPLMIYDPRRPEAERIEYPVSQIDVVPTILERLGYEVDGGELPGMPVAESDEERVVYAHCWYERRCMAQIGYRWKYIDHFGQRNPEVYDLLNDPSETHNLAREMGDQVARWRAETYGWRESVNAMYRAEHSDRVEQYIVDGLPDRATEHQFELGQYIRYLGYELDDRQVRAGGRVRITHYFKTLQPIPAGWRLFVHGQSPQGMINLDHIPVFGLHPLDEWEEGTIIADEHSFRIPRDWAGHRFTLYLGIYHPDQERAPIFGDVATDGERRAVVFEADLER